MIERHASQLVWIGRRPDGPDIRRRIDALAELGPPPVYISADATQRVELTRAFSSALERFGRIDGVTHSALVLGDRGVQLLSEEEFEAVLKAKVDVSVRIAQALEDCGVAQPGRRPDFVLFFSSVTAFTTPKGQSSYSAGCAFKDAFATALRAEWEIPVKVMNWGYWGGIGAVANDEVRAQMVRAGAGSIEPGEAMPALEELLLGAANQVAFVKTRTPEALQNLVGGATAGSHEVAATGSRIEKLRELLSGRREVPTNGAVGHGVII
jgi:NAD(P)-dependent dehydrogenase (short-subunit alcohol dehydrogenase family)